MKPAATWIVNWPRVDLSTIVSFSFGVSIPDGTFAFRFSFVNKAWAAWVTFPDGSVRTAGCIPNVVNWTGYAGDGEHAYVMVLAGDAVVLGQDDLLSATLVIARLW